MMSRIKYRDFHYAVFSQHTAHRDPTPSLVVFDGFLMEKLLALLAGIWVLAIPLRSTDGRKKQEENEVVDSVANAFRQRFSALVG